jgi:murein L,D-transpeptidase YafK
LYIRAFKHEGEVEAWGSDGKQPLALIYTYRVCERSGTPNYPNASDRVLGNKPLGGDIFIHGDCVTIGCLPLAFENNKRVPRMAIDTSSGKYRIRSSGVAP